MKLWPLGEWKPGWNFHFKFQIIQPPLVGTRNQKNNRRHTKENHDSKEINHHRPAAVAWLKHVFNLNPIWRVFKRQVTEGYQHLQSSSVILISPIVIFTRFACSQRLTLEKSYTFTPLLLSLFKYFFVPGTKLRAMRVLVYNFPKCNKSYSTEAEWSIHFCFTFFADTLMIISSPSSVLNKPVIY